MAGRTKLGVALLVAGLSGVILGSMKFESRKEVFRGGDFRATTSHERTIPGVRLAGLGFMLAGAVLMAIQFRQSRCQERG